MSFEIKKGRPMKLTEDDVRLIRAMHDERKRLAKDMSELTCNAIANKFDISPSTVHEITSGYIWKHVV